MSESIHLHFEVSGEDFTRAGEASGKVKKTMKQLGIPAEAIRKVAIAMYEGEINMVIHAGGGEADVDITPESVNMTLTDHGPGIADISKAMQEEWGVVQKRCEKNTNRYSEALVYNPSYMMSELEKNLMESLKTDYAHKIWE